MSLPATDAFTAADATLLTTYSANWTTNKNNFLINTNAAYGNASANDSHAHWNADAFNNDQYAQVVVKAVLTDHYRGCGVRYAAAADTSYVWYMDKDTDHELHKRVAGVETSLGAEAGSSAVNDIIRLEVSGSTLSAKVNGTLAGFGTKSDSAIASGSAGLAAYNNSSSARVDDWEGGNLAAGSTYTETGAGTTPQVASGADTFTTTDTGTGTSPHAAAGADQFTATETGTGFSPAVASGADQATWVETGTGQAPAVASGADTFTSTDTGAGITPAVASGADQATWTETATATATFGASGASVYIPAGSSAVYVKTGTGALSAQAAGADQFVTTDTGEADSPAVAGGQATSGGAGGGMGSWVPFAGLYDAGELARVKVHHGEPHPELNTPALERERLEAQYAEEEELLILSIL